MTAPIPTVAPFVPHCVRCDGTTDLIEGDSAIVCRECVSMLGEIAGNPGIADNRILTALKEKHGDVVTLRRSPDSRGQPTGPHQWVWTPTWPGVDGKPDARDGQWR